MDTDSTSAEDTGNESSDFPDLDTEDQEVLEEEGVTGEEEEDEEEEEEEGVECNEEGNEEDEPVSNDDMEHSVIVVASGCPTGIRLWGSRRTMYRLFTIFHGLREWMVRSRKVGLRELTRYSAEDPPP